MLPVLLDLKFIKIYTFGVFAVLGFFWGLFLLWKLVKLTAYKEEDIFDGFFLALLGGLFLGRVFYVFLNFAQFGFNLLKFILVNGYPGFSVFGLLAGGFILLFIFLRLKKLAFLSVVDYFIPGIFLGLAFGKIGAFLSGAEVGTPTRFFLKIIYSGFDGYRHLTGLWEALLLAAGAHLAYRILLAVRRGRLPRGFVWYFFWFYFGAVYLLLDNLKDDRLYLIGFSFNFLSAAVLVGVFGLYFLVFFRKEAGRWLTGLVRGAFSYVKSAFKTKTRRADAQAHRGRGGAGQKD